MNPANALITAPSATGPLESADLYFRVRRREGRLFPDDVVASLPNLPGDHPLRTEWLARADSNRRLIRYLRGLHRPLTVLDLGCGNGWLSHSIAQLPETRVWGLDRLGPELFQAARLFGAGSAAFLAADIFTSPFAAHSFDVIVLASVIQYFPSLPSLLLALRALLRRSGEIHIVDSPIYSPAEVESARARTAAYYADLGFPEMVAAYFHHTMDSFEEFRPDYLFRPQGITARLSRRLVHTTSPFPWIRIRQAD